MDQVTFPVGDEPVTVTVHVAPAMATTDEGVQLTEAYDAGLGAAFRETVSDDWL